MPNNKIFNVPLRVDLIGRTESLSEPIEATYHENGGTVRQRDVTGNGLAVAELAGRGCYESYERKNPATDSHEGYISQILRHRHYSVLEHVSFAFRISGISRAESHEIVRHRHFGFSQQSQRYCVAEEPYKVALHPTLLEHWDEDALLASFLPQFEDAGRIYDSLREQGLGRKQASEAARAYLPNATATHMVVSGNLRSWLEFVSKRDHEAADRGVRGVAQEIYRILQREVPEVFSVEARKIWDEDFSQAGNSYDG